MANGSNYTNPYNVYTLQNIQSLASDFQKRKEQIEKEQKYKTMQYKGEVSDEFLEKKKSEESKDKNEDK